MLEDGEGSQASQAVLNPSGLQLEMRILRSCTVLRRFGFAYAPSAVQDDSSGIAP